MAKVAYVTGGMGGIGTAICRKFHDAGYKVIAGCGPTRDHAKWLAEQKADGYTFTASVGNVSDWDSTKQAFEKVKSEHGNVDILVNNAGITRDGVFRKMSLEDWRAVMDTNLNSMFNVTKQVIDGMLDKGWGRIINIASVNGEKGSVRADQLFGGQGRHARFHDGACTGSCQQGRDRQHRSRRATSPPTW